MGGEGADRQYEVLDGTVRALKWIFPYLPGKTKYFVSVKKLMTGEGYWTCVKEVLGWLIYMEAVTVAFPDFKHREILQLLSILEKQ